MTDPLEQVLAAESASRERIEAARECFENELRAARIESTRIRERNEQRTRRAVAHAERECVARIMREVDALDTEINNRLPLEEAEAAEQLEALVDIHVERLWPK